MKILLIEDNRAISKGLVYTLEQNGFEVALCENAESTLNSLGCLFFQDILQFQVAVASAFYSIL